MVYAAAVVGAGVVGGATDGHTLGARVTLGAGRTVANSLVLHPLTHGLRAARLVVGATHWGTLSVAADVRGRTVLVAITADFIASNLRVTFVATLAGAEWMMFHNLTVGIDTTLAWVFTEPVEAGFVGGTLGAGLTRGLDDWH